nr:MAG TPA: hypothetical protein [Caudoviricetes sp.]
MNYVHQIRIKRLCDCIAPRDANKLGSGVIPELSDKNFQSHQ